MNNGKIRSFIIVIAVAGSVLLTIWFDTVGAEPEDQCGGNKICIQLLEKGKLAYAQGRYYEAGKYFNRAVNLSPVGTAMTWYRIQAEKHELDDSGSIETSGSIPQPLAEKPLVIQKPKEQMSVIIGDDEGC